MKEPLEMGAHRSMGNRQPMRDLLVRQPGRSQLQDLPLASRNLTNGCARDLAPYLESSETTVGYFTVLTVTISPSED